MHIAANSAGQCGRKQTDSGNCRRHQDWPQALRSPEDDAVLQILVFMALMVEACDHDDAILYSDTKERDKSDRTRHVQGHAAKRQRDQPAKKRHRNDRQN